jgi:lactoylglutathione lyase
LKKFVYTGIEVRNLEESVKFYVEVLGFKIMERRNVEKTGGEFVLLKDEETGQKLELNYYPNHSPKAYRVGTALDHLGFEVDDVHNETNKLHNAGCSIVIPPERRTSDEVSFLKDPNGIWIELFKPLGKHLDQKE